MKRFLNSATINTWVSLAIRIGGLALLLPLILTHLELQQVLVWQLQSSVLAMVIWVDFGMTPTFSRFIAVVRGGGTLGGLESGAGPQTEIPKSEQQKGEPALNLGLITVAASKVYFALAILGTFTIGTIGTFVLNAPISALKVPSEGWTAWGLTLWSIPFALMGGSNGSVLIGCDRITLMRRFESVISVAQIVSTCFVVVSTANLVAIAATYSFWTIVSFFTNAWLRKGILSQEGVSTTSKPIWAEERKVLGLVWSSSWRAGVGVVFSAGVIQGSGMIVPQLASAEVSSAYLLVLRLITVASQLSQAPLYTRLPSMAKDNANGKHADMVVKAEAGFRLSLWTMVIGIFGILMVFPFVLGFIDSSVSMPAPIITVLLCLAFFAERYGSMHMQIFTLSNKVIWHWLNGATGILMIVIFFCLFGSMGIVAMPIAMATAYSFLLAPIASAKSIAFLKQKRVLFERATSFGPLVALFAIVLSFLLLKGAEN